MTAVDDEPASESETSTAQDVTRRRAAGDVALQLVGRTLNLVLGVVVTLVLARHLGARDFGRWSTLFALFQITAYSGNLGLEQAAVARSAEDHAHEPQWLGALVALRFALGVPVFLLTAVVTVVIADSSQMRVAGVIICSVLLLAGFEALRTVFQLRVRNHVTAAMELANGLVWGAAVLLVAAAGGGFVPLAAAFALTSAATVVAQGLLALRMARITFQGVVARGRRLARIGIPIGIGGMLIVAYGRIDQIFVFRLAGGTAAGNYGAAYRILDRVQIVPNAFLVTLFPLMVRARATDLGRLRRLVQTAFDYLLILSLPMLAFTVVAAGRITRLLFGGEFDPAQRALPVLMGAFVLIALGYLVGNLVIVLERQTAFVWCAVTALGVNVVGNLLLIPRYGFVAAAWMTLVTEAVVLALSARLVLREVSLRPRLGRAVRGAVAAAAMAVAVVLVRHATGLGLGVDVLTALVTYPLLLLALRAVDLAELRELVVTRG